MGRLLSAPKREDVREEEKELWDGVVQRRRNMVAQSTSEAHLATGGDATIVPGYYGALLNSPAFCYHQAMLGRYVRLVGDYGDSYSHRDREWVDQVLCHDWKTNVVMANHFEDGLAHGVRIEAIAALREGREEDLTDDERLLTAYIRAVTSGTVTDEQFEAMRVRMGGDRGVVEYTAFIMFLTSTMRLMQALTGDNGVSDAEIMERIEGYRDGSVPIPTTPSVGAG